MSARHRRGLFFVSWLSRARDDSSNERGASGVVIEMMVEKTNKRTNEQIDRRAGRGVFGRARCARRARYEPRRRHKWLRQNLDWLNPSAEAKAETRARIWGRGSVHSMLMASGPVQSLRVLLLARPFHGVTSLYDSSGPADSASTRPRRHDLIRSHLKKDEK